MFFLTHALSDSGLWTDCLQSPFSFSYLYGTLVFFYFFFSLLESVCVLLWFASLILFFFLWQNVFLVFFLLCCLCFLCSLCFALCILVSSCLTFFHPCVSTYAYLSFLHLWHLPQTLPKYRAWSSSTHCLSFHFSLSFVVSFYMQFSPSLQHISQSFHKASHTHFPQRRHATLIFSDLFFISFLFDRRSSVLEGAPLQHKCKRKCIVGKKRKLYIHACVLYEM